MDDQLDNDLSRRIKEVFDNYDDASANEGWLKLREKFPEEKRRRGLIWLWPAAAVLLLFLGLGLVKLYNAQQSNVNHMAHVKQVKQAPSTSDNHTGSNAAQNENTSTTVQPQSHTTQNTSRIAGNNKAAVSSRLTAQQMQAQTGVNSNAAIAQSNAATATYQVKVQIKTHQPVNTRLPQAITASQQAPLLALTDTVKKKSIKLNNNTNQQVAVTKTPNAVAKQDTPASQPVIAAKKPANINEMFAADQGNTPDGSQMKIDRRVKFGIYAATYINYAKNGNNQINAGGGFTAAVPITKNLKFVTGASVNQNSFSYNNQVIFAAAYPTAAMYTAKSNYNFTASTPTSYEHSASLLGIDVPLNLQYQFNTKKNPVYILGGISSGTFINESYGYVYANGSSQEVQTNKGLNDFYFARTLNLGFGVGYPVGKSQIVIEPFLKYPLEGMGAQQLKFGASGINLKFNFSAKK